MLELFSVEVFCCFDLDQLVRDILISSDQNGRVTENEKKKGAYAPSASSFELAF